MLSISTNGRYIISSHQDHQLWLWDIQSKHKQLIARNVNPLSPYFIKRSNSYIFQSDDNIIHLQSINGLKKIVRHLNYPVFGHVITHDLMHYFASDRQWGIYHYDSDNKKRLNALSTTLNFDNIGTLLHMMLSDDERYLLTSAWGHVSFSNRKDNDATLPGDFGVTLWNIENHTAARQYLGNQAKTFAILSPDDAYLLSGDEQGRGFIWLRDKGYLVAELSNIFNLNIKGQTFGESVSIPNDFCEPTIGGCFQRTNIFALRFIDRHYYLRFTPYVPYAILYGLRSKNPLRFFKLSSMADVFGFGASIRVVSAPTAGILALSNVATKRPLVYQYERMTKSLTLIWS